MNLRLPILLHGLLAWLTAALLALAPLGAAHAAADDTDFLDSCAASMRSGAINLTMADLQSGIGDGVEAGRYAEGDLSHAALHGLVGCAAGEALGGNCASGFAAGVAQSVYAGMLDGTGPDKSDTEAHNAWRAQVANQAELIGAGVGYLTSGGLAANVSNGGSIAQSGIVNNYLNHTEWDAYLDALESCGTDTECLDATNQVYWLVSAENTQRMALCGSNAECLQEHYDAMLAVRADAELYAKAQALTEKIGAEIRALEHADARHVVNPSGQWGTSYASYALRSCGGQTSSGCFAAYYDDMKLNWLLSGGSDAMFGFAISAGIAVTPSTIAALRTCAATPYCMTGLATELASGALGEVQGVMMMTAAVGGSSRLVLQHGDKIVGVMDDFGNILKATDSSFMGRLLFEIPEGGVAYYDDAGRLVRGELDEIGEFSRTLDAPNRTQLIDDLAAGGTKITPANVVDIRSINGRTVWLETGNSNAGLRHIVGEHGSEFAQRGIPEAEIPDVLFTALQRNNVVGYQGRGTGRPIYEFDYGGQTHRLAITVGDNGYVVGANFR